MTAMAPSGTATPALSVTRSRGSRIGTARATACRSLRRRTSLSLRSWAIVRSSITQGRLVVLTRPSTTGPATANAPTVTDLPVLARNWLTIAWRLGKSALWNFFWARGSRRLELAEYTARSVLVPPTSPAMRSLSFMSGSGGGKPLAVGLRAVDCEVQDVDVAEHRHEEGRVDPDPNGDGSLDQRENRAPDDGHVQDAGAAAGERAELGHPQAEDRRKHDRVEEADGQDAPHRDVAGGQHRDPHQRCGADGADGEEMSRPEPAEQRCSEEAAHHGAGPVEGDVSRGDLRGQATDV